MDSLQLHFFSEHIKEAQKKEKKGLSTGQKAGLALGAAGTLGLGALVGPGFVRGFKKGYSSATPPVKKSVKKVKKKSSRTSSSVPSSRYTPSSSFTSSGGTTSKKNVSTPKAEPKPKPKPKPEPEKPKVNPDDEIVYRRSPTSESAGTPKKEYRKGDWDKQREDFLNEEISWRDSLNQRKTGKRRDSPRYNRGTYF